MLLNVCKDIGLAANIGKTKYMEIGRHQGVIANSHIKIGSNSYEKVETFKYLGSLLTNQNSIQEEIKCRHSEPVPPGPSSIENDAHGIEKLLLKLK